LFHSGKFSPLSLFFGSTLTSISCSNFNLSPFRYSNFNDSPISWLFTLFLVYFFIKLQQNKQRRKDSDDTTTSVTPSSTGIFSSLSNNKKVTSSTEKGMFHRYIQTQDTLTITTLEDTCSSLLLERWRGSRLKTTT
jgi:hypothetical protein